MAIAIFALSTLGMATGVMAQEQALRATVPFDFSVGDHRLPAATYTITAPLNGVVLVRSADRQHSAMTIALRGYVDTKKGSKLVFTKYGDQYFLHQIVTPSSDAMNVSIPASKSEKRAGSLEVAKGDAEEVMVATL
jgi:hypothetical protein